MIKFAKKKENNWSRTAKSTLVVVELLRAKITNLSRKNSQVQLVEIKSPSTKIKNWLENNR